MNNPFGWKAVSRKSVHVLAGLFVFLTVLVCVVACCTATHCKSFNCVTAALHMSCGHIVCGDVQDIMMGFAARLYISSHQEYGDTLLCA